MSVPEGTLWIKVAGSDGQVHDRSLLVDYHVIHNIYTSGHVKQERKNYHASIAAINLMEQNSIDTKTEEKQDSGTWASWLPSIIASSSSTSSTASTSTTTATPVQIVPSWAQDKCPESLDLTNIGYVFSERTVEWLFTQACNPQRKDYLIRAVGSNPHYLIQAARDVKFNPMCVKDVVIVARLKFNELTERGNLVFSIKEQRINASQISWLLHLLQLNCDDTTLSQVRDVGTFRNNSTDNTWITLPTVPELVAVLGDNVHLIDVFLALRTMNHTWCDMQTSEFYRQSLTIVALSEQLLPSLQMTVELLVHRAIRIGAEIITNDPAVPALVKVANVTQDQLKQLVQGLVDDGFKLTVVDRSDVSDGTFVVEAQPDVQSRVTAVDEPASLPQPYLPGYAQTHQRLLNEDEHIKLEQLSMGMSTDDRFPWAHNIIMAGGSILQALHGGSSTADHETDVDIFLLNYHRNATSKAAYSALRGYLTEKFPNALWAFKNAVLCIWPRMVDADNVTNPSRMIQVIPTASKTIQDQLLSFDLSYCQIGYNGVKDKETCRSVVTHSGAFRWSQTSRLSKLTTGNVSTNLRLYRAGRKGYPLMQYQLNNSDKTDYNDYVRDSAPIEEQIKYVVENIAVDIVDDKETVLRKIAALDTEQNFPVHQVRTSIHETSLPWYLPCWHTRGMANAALNDMNTDDDTDNNDDTSDDGFYLNKSRVDFCQDKVHELLTRLQVDLGQVSDYQRFELIKREHPFSSRDYATVILSYTDSKRETILVSRSRMLGINVNNGVVYKASESENPDKLLALVLRSKLVQSTEACLFRVVNPRTHEIEVSASMSCLWESWIKVYEDLSTILDVIVRNQSIYGADVDKVRALRGDYRSLEDHFTSIMQSRSTRQLTANDNLPVLIVRCGALERLPWKVAIDLLGSPTLYEKFQLRLYFAVHNLNMTIRIKAIMLYDTLHN